MAYKEKDTKKWTAQWFETNAKGEKKKRRKRGFETKREALEYERQKKLNNSRSMDMKLSEFMEVQIDTHCYERMELPVEQTKARVDITEKLKATDQMNNVRKLAEKIILIELIYVQCGYGA